MSNGELDPNKVLSKIATDIVERTFRKMAAITDGQIGKLKVRYQLGFTKYIQAIHARNSSIKTIISRDASYQLNDLYVPQQFLHDKLTVSEESLINMLTNGNRRVLVEGIAGSGKTIFMKRLLCNLCSEPKEKLPLFFELRNLNTDPKRPLISFISQTVSDFVETFDDQQLLYGIGLNRFLLILDAFDEVPFSMKNERARELMDLVTRYPNLSIVITSRPDEFYSVWPEFFVYRVCPLGLEQVRSLIDKVHYDAKAKAEFIGLLGPGFYEQHQSFLSNPLMALLMLMTYSDVAEIPTRSHVFYEQAFQVLYHRFDATKDIFKREFSSGLDIDHFRKLFSAFCFITYLREIYALSDSQYYESARAAAGITGIQVDARAFLEDLMISVSMLQKDGNNLSFVHRSFQEYFAADFVSRNRRGDSDKIFALLVARCRTDNVLFILCDIDPNLVATAWVMPFLRSLAARRKRYKDLRRGLINLFYPRVALKPSFRLVATSRELERGFHALTALFGIDDDVNFPKRSARSDFSSDGDVVWRYISAEGNKGAEAKRTGVQIRHDKWAARIFRGETARDEGEGIELRRLPSAVLQQLVSLEVLIRFFGWLDTFTR